MGSDFFTCYQQIGFMRAAELPYSLSSAECKKEKAQQVHCEWFNNHHTKLFLYGLSIIKHYTYHTLMLD